MSWAYKKAAHIPVPKPVVHYVDVFDKAAENIRKSVKTITTASGDIQEYHYKITGE